MRAWHGLTIVCPASRRRITVGALITLATACVAEGIALPFRLIKIASGQLFSVVYRGRSARGWWDSPPIVRSVDVDVARPRVIPCRQLRQGI